jgi:hypothetical protein
VRWCGRSVRGGEAVWHEPPDCDARSGCGELLNCALWRCAVGPENHFHQCDFLEPIREVDAITDTPGVRGRLGRLRLEMTPRPGDPSDRAKCGRGQTNLDGLSMLEDDNLALQINGLREAVEAQTAGLLKLNGAVEDQSAAIARIEAAIVSPAR